jgi:hypothetical protein
MCDKIKILSIWCRFHFFKTLKARRQTGFHKKTNGFFIKPFVFKIGGNLFFIKVSCVNRY